MKTLDRYDIKDTYIPIRESEKLLTNGEYKKNQPLVIFISGFTTNLRKERSPSHDTLAEVYVRFRPELNFMVSFVFKIIIIITKTKYFLSNRPSTQVRYQANEATLLHKIQFYLNKICTWIQNIFNSQRRISWSFLPIIPQKCNTHQTNW